jgi:Na+/proline symporter
MTGATEMSAHFTGLDLAVLAGYFLATMAVGFACSRRSRSVEGFTAADRDLPGWLTGLSILGTYVTSITFLAVPAKAYASNWNAFAFSFALPLATWIAVRWFLPFYRRNAHVSAYQHLETRQNYVQRGIAAKSDAEARKSVWLGGLTYVPLSAVFLFIGTALFACYAVRPDALSPAYRDLSRTDSVFPWFIVTVLPSGVTGLLVAAIFAAAMSTVSTSLNSSATIILNNTGATLTGTRPSASPCRSSAGRRSRGGWPGRAWPWR